jgi:L-amino acid N-acyltransferase YncA
LEFSIRAAQEEDAESIVAVLNPIIQAGTYTVMDEPVTVAEQVEFIRGFPARGVYLVALHDGSGEVLGLQDVQPITEGTRALGHVGEISTFVSLSARRAGVGSALMRASIAKATGRGFRKLMATIRTDNPEAVAFYRRQGFDLVGTLRDHASLGGEYVDELLLEKLID